MLSRGAPRPVPFNLHPRAKAGLLQQAVSQALWWCMQGTTVTACRAATCEEVAAALHRPGPSLIESRGVAPLPHGLPPHARSRVQHSTALPKPQAGLQCQPCP